MISSWPTNSAPTYYNVSLFQILIFLSEPAAATSRPSADKVIY